MPRTLGFEGKLPGPRRPSTDPTSPRTVVGRLPGSRKPSMNPMRPSDNFEGRLPGWAPKPASDMKATEALNFKIRLSVEMGAPTPLSAVDSKEMAKFYKDTEPVDAGKGIKAYVVDAKAGLYALKVRTKWYMAEIP